MSGVGSAILGLVAGLGTLIGGAFAIRMLYQWIFPIRIEPSYCVFIDGSEHDEISAKLINRNSEAQYVVRCQARSTYPLWIIIKRHLRTPFLSPHLYSTIRFNSPSFTLLGSGNLRLEPYEPVDMKHKISNHPLLLFLTPMFQIEVQLSTGRIFRSRRVAVPERWRFRG